MRRRIFLQLVGSAAAAWPVATRAQLPDRVRRLGVLTSLGRDDPETNARARKLELELQKLGWTPDRNIRIDYRFGTGDANLIRAQAADLVTTTADVILASGSQPLLALQQATRTIPIVFVQVVDPVSRGFVASLARPGGNITGFAIYDYEMAGKWLDILKEIASRLTRVAIVRDPALASQARQLDRIQVAAQPLGLQLAPINVRDAGEIEGAISTFAKEPNGGLIVLPSGLAAVHRDLIIALAAKHRLPAVYPYQYFVKSGGLVSYGVDTIDLWRRAASYVDRILKGDKPADLPVQAPTKFEFIINLKTANALGLTVPPTLLAQANEVIE